MEGPGGERASRGDFQRLMGLMMSSKETEKATTQEVGRSASLAGGQLGVEAVREAARVGSWERSRAGQHRAAPRRRDQAGSAAQG